MLIVGAKVKCKGMGRLAYKYLFGAKDMLAWEQLP